MATQTAKSKPSKSPTPSLQASKSTSLSSHFAMIELKQRILSSISKLSDRDTHQIAVEDLENVIQTISPDGVSMLLNCLYEASGDPKPTVKKEALRLIALLCTSHGESTSTHLTKIIGYIVKRLKDSDSGVRDSCRDAIGVLSAQYLKGDGDNGNLGSVVSLFVKPLFETMGDEKKAVQAGAAMCMAKMVECAVTVPVPAFQKLCPRICKCLNSQNFLAKAGLLTVIANLSKVGAIASQSMPTLLQSIHECLESSDWTTRKAAADTFSTLACHSSHLITEKVASTITALETCRFDKVKPVRESMIEALQLWKKIAEKGCEGVPDSQIASCEAAASTEKPSLKISNLSEAAKNGSSTSTDSISDNNGSNISDKTAVILKKKAPTLSNKEVNPEFFQKLETRSSSGDLPVEVVVPCRSLNSSSIKRELPDQNDTTYRGNSSHDDTNGGDAHVSGNGKYDTNDRRLFGKQQDIDDLARDRWTESRAFKRSDLTARGVSVNDRVEVTQRDQTNARSHAEDSFTENKGNWITIQRQLSQMERQQTHLMNMLQDFMGGSHDSMVTLENRVRGLERIVEDMQRELAISSGRRASNFITGYEGSSARPLGKYGLSERDQPWDSFPYSTSRNGYMGSRRVDPRSSRLENVNENDQISTRRAWDKGPGRIRLGEGPSARSVWHSSKDEATLEAIRVAGDDNGKSRPVPQRSLPELVPEAMGDEGMSRQEQGSVTWTNVMDAIHVGNMEMAYSEALSTGDDFLLVKLMDRSGPVMDQLSDDIAVEILHVVRQFLLEQSLFDIGLSWIQQLVDLVLENGPDVFSIPMENKKEILLSLRDASSVIDPPQDWEGETPDQLMLQLASAWEINLQ